MRSLPGTWSKQSGYLFLFVSIELLNVLNRLSHHPLLIVNRVDLELFHLLLVGAQALLDVAS